MKIFNREKQNTDKSRLKTINELSSAINEIENVMERWHHARVNDLRWIIRANGFITLNKEHKTD